MNIFCLPPLQMKTCLSSPSFGAASMTSCIPPTPCWRRFLTQRGPLQVQTHWCLDRAGAQRWDEDSFILVLIWSFDRLLLFCVLLHTAPPASTRRGGVALCTLRVNMHNESGEILYESVWTTLFWFRRKTNKHETNTLFFPPRQCYCFQIQCFFLIHDSPNPVGF